MKFRLRTPRAYATRLRARARQTPREVAEYLDQHPEEWEALAIADPADAADILEELGDEAATELIGDLDPDDAAEVLDELRTDLAVEIIEDLDIDASAAVLGAMAPMEAADVIGALDDERRTELLGAMETGTAQAIEQLLSYPADSAGGLMTTEVAALPIGLTAGEAIEAIRRLHETFEDLSYIYVVDDDHRLVGVLSFRDLVFQRPGAGLADAMIADPVAVTPLTDREEVAELTQRYNLFGLPVVEDDGTLLGMVNTEAVLETIQQEASEDFAVAVGAGVTETAYSPVWNSFKNRLPWLAVNLVLALGTLEAIRSQSAVIEGLPVLAALMPLVASLGGNAGAQSLAVVIRSLATDDVPRSEVGGILVRQLAIGAGTGVAIGILAFAAATLRAPLDVALVVGIASFVNLIVATVAGSGIPLVLRALNLDPALASNIFVTLVTDLAGFGGFLLMAGILLF